MIAESGWVAQASILDGECERTKFGFDSLTKTRRLFVPFAKAKDAIEALVMCERDGLLIEKVARLSQAQREFLVATTLPRPILLS